MNGESPISERWLGVIGRALAYASVQSPNIKDKSLAERASFLEALGLERSDVAVLLGATPKTITEVLSRAKSTKGKRKNGKKKARAR